MLILTAGDHRFQEMVLVSARQARRFGYDFCAFDLGGLGFGRPFSFPTDTHGPRPQTTAAASADSVFADKGYYLEFQKGYYTRALHKPWIVKECLDSTSDLVIYLDGDAFLLEPIDEILTGDYDVGVVMREDDDVTGHPEITGIVNAGVMFFANTPQCKRFVDLWLSATVEVGNDQFALNRLLAEPNHYWKLQSRSSRWKKFKRRIRGKEPPRDVWKFASAGMPRDKNISGIRVRIFDATYNSTQFPLPTNSKVAHFKGSQKSRFQDYCVLSAKLGERAA